jgi:Flp pilus assembly protein CpaB
VYWLQRPPYLVRAGLVALVLAALWWDIAAARTEAFPVAARDIAAGSVIGSADISWAPVPVGAFPIQRVEGAVARVAIPAGDPIAGSMLGEAVSAPQDWWTVPLQIGPLAVPGDEVLMVVADPPFSTTGIVVAAQSGERYSLDYRPGSVAVPPQAAPVIAAAEREGRLTTAIRATTAHR